METKEQLKTIILEFIKLDKDLLKLKSEVKEKTMKRKQYMEDLVTIMKSNSIDCFDINGGSLVYKQNKVKKTLSGKSLLVLLKKYYDDDNETAEKLKNYLMENREETVKETIKHKITKDLHAELLESLDNKN